MENSPEPGRENSAESSEKAEKTAKTEKTESRHHPALRVMLLVAGTLSVAIGVIGIYLPVLPTTPFLLLAAACYVRSSERMYRWLLGEPRLGREMQAILEKRGLPRNVKTFSLLFAWIVLGGLALFVVESALTKALLIALALIKTAVLLRMPTAEKHRDERSAANRLV